MPRPLAPTSEIHTECAGKPYADALEHGCLTSRLARPSPDTRCFQTRMYSSEAVSSTVKEAWDDGHRRGGGHRSSDRVSFGCLNWQHPCVVRDQSRRLPGDD